MPTLLTSIFPLLFALPLSTGNPNYSPFFPPSLQQPNANRLLPRQNQCSSNGISCANLGSPNLCCKSSASCAVDQAGHIACCPANSACTGTIDSGSIITSIPTSALVGVSTATTAGASVVPNGFFPYVYLPTTYANAAVCTQSYSSCQGEFTSCTASLGNGYGGGNGVTVNGGGIPGITVQGPVGSVSAASICSSLSLEACHNLQLANCATFPSGTAAATGTFVVPGSAVGERRRERGTWAVGVGVGVVVVGMMW